MILPIIARVKHLNPLPTVDIIIEIDSRIVLIKRKNPPPGWALPGGFIEYGESAEDAARREAREETGLEIMKLGQFHCYSDPKRDPRHHTISIVFVAQATGQPVSGDDASELALYDRKTLPENIAFDHRRILDDYFNQRH